MLENFRILTLAVSFEVDEALTGERESVMLAIGVVGAEVLAWGDATTGVRKTWTLAIGVREEEDEEALAVCNEVSRLGTGGVVVAGVVDAVGGGVEETAR